MRRHADPRFWRLCNAMSNIIDRALNRITMYRLALYYVAGLLVVAFGLGFFKFAPVDPTALAFSFVVIAAVCWFANRLFAMFVRVPANTEIRLYHRAHPHADSCRPSQPRTGSASQDWSWPLSSPSPRNSHWRLAASIFSIRSRSASPPRRCCSTSPRPGGWAAISRCCPLSWRAVCSSFARCNAST